MEFMLGCNYWASNAGALMWERWDADAVDKDLKVLSENGVSYMRVFPNWRDFQPVKVMRQWAGNEYEYLMTDESFPTNENYLDETMLARFNEFCSIAEKYNIKLIVGLLTGWMSGRLFVPPILEGLNLYTDPTALLFEMRFIKGFIGATKHQKSIFAWDLGNECNCLTYTEYRSTASSWTAIVANTIKAYDSTRPVVSGMHSLGTENAWTIFDQAEHTDILTTHPYPHFVPHCFKNTLTSQRTLLHPSCETAYYSDIGKKPCFVEEIGTLGPMTCNDETASKFLFNNLFSVWANGSKGLMFWCNSDFADIDRAPYTWDMMEDELGLADKERKPRKTLLAIKKFSQFLKKFGGEINPPEKEAVLISTRNQDAWGAAYSAYILAKQNDLTLSFAWSDQKLPDSEIYMLPSICSTRVMCMERYLELLERVRNGAALYISNDNGFVAKFAEISGIEVVNSLEVDEDGFTELYGEKIEFKRRKRYIVKPCGAKVLSYDNLGNPAICENKYGKGRVFYVNFPLETMLADDSFGFEQNRHLVYKKLFENTEQIVRSNDIKMSVTRHKHGEKYICTAINYGDESLKNKIEISKDFAVSKVIYGDIENVEPHDACVFEIEKI